MKKPAGEKKNNKEKGIQNRWEGRSIAGAGLRQSNIFSARDFPYAKQTCMKILEGKKKGEDTKERYKVNEERKRK